MFIKSPRFLSLLILWSLLVSIISAVPNLGVQRDFVEQFPHDSLMSYSAVIKFNDQSIPGDKTKMSDAQFINLAKVAYDEMVDIWSRSNFNSDGCPGALIAMESAGFMYFASAIRSPDRGVDFNIADQAIQDSIGWFQLQCARQGMGTHRTGGRCAEPNVLRLYGDKNGLTTDNPPKYTAPPTSNTSPRVAVWGRPSGALPNQNKEFYLIPCSDSSGSGYGCTRLVTRYGLKPVSKQNPDPSGQDNWAFSRSKNPRDPCPAPPS